MGPLGPAYMDKGLPYVGQADLEFLSASHLLPQLAEGGLRPCTVAPCLLGGFAGGRGGSPMEVFPLW